MPESVTPQLSQGLSQRQLMMIAIGGIIGAGFFVGSGVVIGRAGPAAFLTYALCGVILGRSATMTVSTLPKRQPCSASRSRVYVRKARLVASFQRGPLEGKWLLMSPSAAAPKSPSTMA